MLIVVIDDERTLLDERAHHFRTSEKALQWLQHPHIRSRVIDQLWLDHDLGGDDTIRPVVDYLEEQVFNGNPIPIDTIYVHTANPVGADMMLRSRLLTQQYKVTRIGLERFVCA